MNPFGREFGGDGWELFAGHRDDDGFRDLSRVSPLVRSNILIVAPESDLDVIRADETVIRGIKTDPTYRRKQDFRPCVGFMGADVL